MTRNTTDKQQSSERAPSPIATPITTQSPVVMTVEGACAGLGSGSSSGAAAGGTIGSGGEGFGFGFGLGGRG